MEKRSSNALVKIDRDESVQSTLSQQLTSHTFEFVLITDPEFSSTMKDNLYQDVTFVVGTERKKFNLNLTLFSIFSPKIRDMMKHAFSYDSILQEIEFRDIDPSDFVLIDTLLRRGKIKISSENALRLLRMSTYFQINCLKNYVVSVIEENEGFLSGVDLYVFAFESNQRHLINLALSRMATMRESVFFSEALERYISEGAFKNLLSKAILFVWGF